MKTLTLAIALSLTLPFGYISHTKNTIFGISTQHRTSNYQDLQEKEEFRQTYRLSSATLVDISDINGVLEIESTESDTTELYIVRSAKERKDLEFNRIKVEQNDQTFRISSEPNSGYRKHAEVRQRIHLKLPTNVNLSLSDISGLADVERVQGSLKINDISGQVSIKQAASCQAVNDISGQVHIGKLTSCNKIQDISGQVHIDQVTNCQEISDISGQVEVGIQELNNTGLKIYDISGNVNLKFQNQINADLKARDINGSVAVNISSWIITNKHDRNNFDGRIGSGGTPIVVQDISGAIHLKQLEAN